VRKAGLVVIWALAMVGVLTLVGAVSTALQRHYAVQCVDNSDDAITEYGFTERRSQTGFRQRTGVQGVQKGGYRAKPIDRL